MFDIYYYFFFSMTIVENSCETLVYVIMIKRVVITIYTRMIDNIINFNSDMYIF